MSHGETVNMGVPVRTFEQEVREVLARVESLLMLKNSAYGDSALNPLRVFSQADVGEQLRVRLDDKLSRLARGTAAGEDQVDDILGYLVLLKIHEKRVNHRADATDVPGSGVK